MSAAAQVFDPFLLKSMGIPQPIGIAVEVTLPGGVVHRYISQHRTAGAAQLEAMDTYGHEAVIRTDGRLGSAS